MALMSNKKKLSSLSDKAAEKSRSIQKAEDLYTQLCSAVENENLNLVSLLLEDGVTVNPRSRNVLTPLHLAAQKGNKQIIQLLLRHGANPNSPGYSLLETPLYLSAKIGNPEVVEILLEASTQHAKELNQFIAIYFAAFHGHERVVKLLLDKRVDPNYIYKKYLTPLHAASQQGHVNIVHLLLNHGAEVNPKPTRFSTPLIAAAFSGHEKIVEILLNHGADINAKLGSEVKGVNSKIEKLLVYGYDSYLHFFSGTWKVAFMPIHCAAENGRKSIVDMLVKLGADVNAKAKHNETPLWLAVNNEREEVVAYLLEAGAQVESKVFGQLTLFTAIKKKNANIFKLLFRKIDHEQFASTMLVEKKTPLSIAVYNKSAEIVEFLLQNGADPNFHNEEDFPLHIAAEICDISIVAKLIEHGADVNSECKELGLTPLFHSLAIGRMDVFKLILKKGGSLDKKTNNGSTLLHFAIIRGLKAEPCKFLLECGADLNAKDNNGVIPFEIRICDKRARSVNNEDRRMFEEENCENDDVLELLLEYGSDAKHKFRNINDETALNLATLALNVGAVRPLLRYGADINFPSQLGDTSFCMAVDQASETLPDVRHGGFEYILEEDEEEFWRHDLDNTEFEEYFVFDRYRQNFSEIEFKKFIRDSARSRKIARIMTQEIVKMKAGGREVSGENLTILNNSKFVKRFRDRCQRELEKIKRKKVFKHISYFDILIADDRKLIRYARNMNIVEAMESGDCKVMFLLYADDLEFQMKKGIKMKHLFEMSAKFFSEVLRIKLPYFIVHKIFNFLGVNDLRNLCRIRNPFMLLTSEDREFINSGNKRH